MAMAAGRARTDPVSLLEVTFPDEWLPLATRSTPVARPVPPGGAGGHVVPSQVSGPADALVSAVAELGLDGVAFLVLPDPRAGKSIQAFSIQAFCAIGVLPQATGDHAELRAVAESGRHPGLERDTLAVELSVGPGVRSSAFRFADELLDDWRVVPFAAEIRFTLPLPGRRIGVLHFETLSLSCFEELETLFDLIAGTARVA
jgi:hypothetical protein